MNQKRHRFSRLCLVYFGLCQIPNLRAFSSSNVTSRDMPKKRVVGPKITPVRETPTVGTKRSIIISKSQTTKPNKKNPMLAVSYILWNSMTATMGYDITIERHG